MKLLCIFCRRLTLRVVLDPDLIPTVAMCEDCYASRATKEPENG